MQPDDRASLDYLGLVREAKGVDAASLKATVRLALLSDGSTQHLVPPLRALFARAGIRAEVHEALFGAILQQASDPAAELYAFKPDFVVVLNSTHALRSAWYSAPGPAAEFAAGALAGIREVWKAVAKNSSATVVQSNFAVPCERVFGNFELKADAELPAAVLRLNASLAEAARADGRVLLNDVEHLSSYWGRRRWLDEKMWMMAKIPCGMDCLPALAQNLVDIVRAARGGAAKCVVVDLDNTLWGGVIGDDGVAGIKVGTLGEGEPYRAFQQYLLRLKARGMLLAACSRNAPETAVLPFREHPEMALKESDFAAFVANWGNKADNLRSIAEALNIGLDSLVFVDDDPFERNLVRRMAPEVVVPEMPEEPADFAKTLSELNLFETASFSAEDRARAEMYRAQAVRAAARSSFSSTEDYLRSLNMRIRLARFDAANLPRVAQLIARSNQFNLTTRRYAEADCERLMNDRAGAVPFFVTLSDDLGDSGLIAVVVLLRRGDVLEIDEWLMSCRVLLRGVEDRMMNEVAAFARRAGFKRVRGLYVPTAKNGMVKDFFGRYGFVKSGDEWTLDVSRYVEKPTYFSSAEADLNP
ncbi:MAG: HAD-IIIC family phosphatase [Elusimicrobiota bacterium]